MKKGLLLLLASALALIPSLSRSQEKYIVQVNNGIEDRKVIQEFNGLPNTKKFDTFIKETMTLKGLMYSTSIATTTSLSREGLENAIKATIPGDYECKAFTFQEVKEGRKIRDAHLAYWQVVISNPKGIKYFFADPVYVLKNNKRVPLSSLNFKEIERRMEFFSKKSNKISNYIDRRSMKIILPKDLLAEMKKKGYKYQPRPGDYGIKVVYNPPAKREPKNKKLSVYTKTKKGWKKVSIMDD